MMKQPLEGKEAFKILSPGMKICIMGIGNFDRADDQAGGVIIDGLKEKNLPENIFLINAGPSPESFTGVIKRFKPDVLIIIDAAHMGEEPGTIRTFTEEDIVTVSMVTPHKVPMTMFTKYLKNYLENLETLFIGIQPVSLRYYEPISKVVQKNSDFLIEYLTELLLKLE